MSDAYLPPARASATFGPDGFYRGLVSRPFFVPARIAWESSVCAHDHDTASEAGRCAERRAALSEPPPAPT